MSNSEPHNFWPHAPEHRLGDGGAYFVTAGTYQKHHIFRTNDDLKALHGGLLKYAAQYEWQLEAWAVFSNHYHFIAQSPVAEAEAGDGARSLRKFLAHFHSRSAAWINDRHEMKGRKVWQNFWDTQLTHQSSYLARLHYVHANPVKHGLVPVAQDYPWCSAGWFERTASAAKVKTIYGFKTDRVNVPVEFEPIWSAQA
ncbi:MAG: transposase [Verrucomicrobiales bacterium]